MFKKQSIIMLKPIQDILNKQLLRNKPTYEQFSIFLEALLNLQNSILPNESEEHNKNYILEFLLINKTL